MRKWFNIQSFCKAAMLVLLCFAALFTINSAKANDDDIDRELLMYACEDSCAPVCNYEGGKCSFCELFATFFNAVSKTTKSALNAYSDSVYKVVIAGFAIWIALQILAFVSSVEVKDIRDFVVSLINQSFIVIICLVLLESGANNFFNDALEPIFNTGMKASQTILSPGEAVLGTNNEEYQCSTGEYNLYDSGENGKGALPKKMGESILCTMGLIQDRAERIRALSSSALCYSWEKRAFIIPHLGYALVGIGLWVGAILIILAVPFAMIDSVLQLGIAGALLPFAIGAYAFKITRKYTGKIWETFLNSMFAFLFISLIALMITAALENIIVKTAGPELFTDLNIDLEAVFSNLSWFSASFLEICFVLILAWAVIGTATGFANSFAGSIGTSGIGSSIGTMAGSFAKQTASKVLDKSMDAVASKVIKETKNAAHNIAGRARNIKRNAQAANIAKKGTYDPNTNSYVYKTKSKILRRDKTLTLSETSDGKKTVTESKIADSTKVRLFANGKLLALEKGSKEITKLKSDNMSIRTQVKFDENGNEVSRQDRVRVNSAWMHDLVKEDGSINMENYNKALSSFENIPEQEALTIAFQKQLLSKTIPNTKMNMKNHKYVSQNVLRDTNGNIVGFEEMHPDGSKTLVKMNLDSKTGRMMTEMTQIDKKGKATSLATDGVINRKQNFKVNGSVANIDLNNIDAATDENSIKTTYGYADVYDYYNRTRRYKNLNSGLQNSLFSAAEITDAKDFIAGHHEMQNAAMYEFKRNYSK